MQALNIGSISRQKKATSLGKQPSRNRSGVRFPSKAPWHRYESPLLAAELV